MAIRNNKNIVLAPSANLKIGPLLIEPDRVTCIDNNKIDSLEIIYQLERGQLSSTYLEKIKLGITDVTVTQLINKYNKYTVSLVYFFDTYSNIQDSNKEYHNSADFMNKIFSTVLKNEDNNDRTVRIQYGDEVSNSFVTDYAMITTVTMSSSSDFSIAYTINLVTNIGYLDETSSENNNKVISFPKVTNYPVIPYLRFLYKYTYLKNYISKVYIESSVSVTPTGSAVISKNGSSYIDIDYIKMPDSIFACGSNTNKKYYQWGLKNNDLSYSLDTETGTSIAKPAEVCLLYNSEALGLSRNLWQTVANRMQILGGIISDPIKSSNVTTVNTWETITHKIIKDPTGAELDKFIITDLYNKENLEYSLGDDADTKDMNTDSLISGKRAARVTYKKIVTLDEITKNNSYYAQLVDGKYEPGCNLIYVPTWCRVYKDSNNIPVGYLPCGLVENSLDYEVKYSIKKYGETETEDISYLGTLNLKVTDYSSELLQPGFYLLTKQFKFYCIYSGLSGYTIADTSILNKEYFGVLAYQIGNLINGADTDAAVKKFVLGSLNKTRDPKALASGLANFITNRDVAELNIKARKVSPVVLKYSNTNKAFTLLPKGSDTSYYLALTFKFNTDSEISVASDYTYLSIGSTQIKYINTNMEITSLSGNDTMILQNIDLIDNDNLTLTSAFKGDSTNRTYVTEVDSTNKIYRFIFTGRDGNNTDFIRFKNMRVLSYNNSFGSLTDISMKNTSTNTNLNTEYKNNCSYINYSITDASNSTHILKSYSINLNGTIYEFLSTKSDTNAIASYISNCMYISTEKADIPQGIPDENYVESGSPYVFITYNKIFTTDYAGNSIYATNSDGSIKYKQEKIYDIDLCKNIVGSTKQQAAVVIFNVINSLIYKLFGKYSNILSKINKTSAIGYSFNDFIETGRYMGLFIDSMKKSPSDYLSIILGRLLNKDKKTYTITLETDNTDPTKCYLYINILKTTEEIDLNDSNIKRYKIGLSDLDSSYSKFVPVINYTINDYSTFLYTAGSEVTIKTDENGELKTFTYTDSDGEIKTGEFNENDNDAVLERSQAWNNSLTKSGFISLKITVPFDSTVRLADYIYINSDIQPWQTGYYIVTQISTTLSNAQTQITAQRLGTTVTAS